MKPEYQQVTQIEGHFSGGKFVGINIQLAYHREVTKDESFEMLRHLDSIVKMLRKNDLLNDKHYQREIFEEKNALLACFGNVAIYAKEIPNEYEKDSLKPWYLVTTPKGVIKIGWRKRVINIDWEQSDIKHDGRDLFYNEVKFLGETTTAEKTYVHAYGYEKAKEYIQKLLN